MKKTETAKEGIEILKTWVIMGAIGYIIGSICAWDLYIGDWHWGGRAFYAFTVFAFGSFVALRKKKDDNS